MAWHTYESSGDSVIGANTEECPVTPDFLGHNTIAVKANVNIEVNNKVYHLDGIEGSTDIDVVGPSLKTNDDLYILTYDQKFINVRR